MGFDKRYINEEIIRTTLKENGFEYLIDFIQKPEVLITEDEFSKKVCEIVKETKKIYILEKLLKIL